MISSQVQQFLTPSQSLIFFAILDLFARASLPGFFIAFALEQQIFTSSQSLLCNSSSLRGNSYFLHLHIFPILELFTILDLFARIYLFAIFDLFARTALRNSLLLRNP